MTSAGAKKEAFGVYVHWPFCLSKCPYCDFNSHVRHEPIDEERFARAFAREIETTAARAPGREVSSIFLGGGTPSLMKPQTVGAILDAIGKHWRVAPMSKSRWRPIPPASRRRALPAIAQPASTASRSACRRWTTPR